MGTIEVRAHRAVRTEIEHKYREHRQTHDRRNNHTTGHQQLARGDEFGLAEKAAKGRVLHHGAT